MTPRPDSVLADTQPPIEIGRVLSDTFALIGDRAGTVFGIALITVLPARLATLAFVTQGIPLTDPSRSPFDYGVAVATLGVLGLVMGVFGQGALIGAALARRDGRASDLFETLVPAIRQLLIIVPVSLIYIVGLVLGMVLLIVPGMILLTMWSVPGPVIVAERTGIIATFRRNQELTRNTRWRIFLLLFVVGIATGLFNWLAGHLGLVLFDSASRELAYASEPAPFLFETFILMLTHAFSLAMICTLYIALIERHGDGPMSDRLTHIFA